LAASRLGLCGLWFAGQKYEPDTTEWIRDDTHELLMRAASSLSAYLDGRAEPISTPLDLSRGTAFQQTVWRALLAIPRGHTVGYADLSRRIGRPTATRAVGAAIGRNPISVFIPCHRVVGATGSLTGYAGGLHRKFALLQFEGAPIEPARQTHERV
jgi:methylated-DNA-[protein]-cysteine S-methyltransferase